MLKTWKCVGYKQVCGSDSSHQTPGVNQRVKGSSACQGNETVHLHLIDLVSVHAGLGELSQLVEIKKMTMIEFGHRLCSGDNEAAVEVKSERKGYGKKRVVVGG